MDRHHTVAPTRPRHRAPSRGTGYEVHRARPGCRRTCRRREHHPAEATARRELSVSRPASAAPAPPRDLRGREDSPIVTALSCRTCGSTAESGDSEAEKAPTISSGFSGRPHAHPNPRPDQKTATTAIRASHPDQRRARKKEEPPYRRSPASIRDDRPHRMPTPPCPPA